MYRLARPRQALRLESVARVRSYSTAPSEAHGQTQPSDGAPRTQRKYKPDPLKLGNATAYTARVDSTEDSLAGTLLRETKAGHAAQAMSNRIEEMAARRRAQRLKAEAKQAQEAPSQPAQAQPATLLTSKDVASSAPVHDRTSHFKQNRGQFRTDHTSGDRQPGQARTPNFSRSDATRFTNRDGASGAPTRDRTSHFKQSRGQFRTDRASGDRPYKNNNNFKSNTRRPPPRVSTVNFAPKRTAQTADDSADLTAEDLDPNVEAPNYPGPFAVSPDLRNIFRKPASSQLDVALSRVSSSSPSSLKDANRILRRFAGDYSASLPKPSQGLYTTPIQTLPVRTQLELAMAKSKDLNIPSRQYLTQVVSKAIGEVPSGTVV